MDAIARMRLGEGKNKIWEARKNMVILMEPPKRILLFGLDGTLLRNIYQNRITDILNVYQP